MTLPYDIARCAGAAAPLCEHCRRRDPGGERQPYIAPSVTLAGCQNYIEPLPTTTAGGTMFLELKAQP